MENEYTIHQLHEMFLEMMKDFHNYCIHNNLRYFMVGGTLLGAAREKGFIPWDDDVDFAMPRPDYEAFIQTYKGKYRIEHYKKNPHYMFPYLKLFHHEKAIIHVVDAEFGIDSNVFLKFDIYPIDGIGNDMNKAQWHAKIVQKTRNLSFLNLSRDKSKSCFRNILLSIIRKLPSIWFLRFQDYLMSFYDYENSEFVTRWRMPDLAKNVVPKLTFGDGCLLPFADINLVAPINYHNYLVLVYGNYLVPVRENNGLRHDCNSNVISQSFTSYLKNNTI